MSAVAAFLQRREEEKLAEKPVIGHKIYPEMALFASTLLHLHTGQLAQYHVVVLV